MKTKGRETNQKLCVGVTHIIEKETKIIDFNSIVMIIIIILTHKLVLFAINICEHTHTHYWMTEVDLENTKG